MTRLLRLALAVTMMLPLAGCFQHTTKDKVPQKASQQVRLEPQTFGLWGFRLSQHVNAGTYGYSEVWETLEAAALDAGVCETRVTRILYSSFADAMRSSAAPMPLSVLKGGVQ